MAFEHEPALLAQTVRACTRVTHTDPKAFEAALAVAVAAGCAARAGAPSPVSPASPSSPSSLPPSEPFSRSASEALEDFTAAFRQALGQSSGGSFGNNAAGAAQDALAAELALLRAAVEEGLSVPGLAARLGCGNGVTGYALHTVPVALYAWMRHAGDLRAAVTAVVNCGGDTDSTAAITGGIVGAGLGPEGVPPNWLANLLEWPRGPAWMGRLAPQVAAAVHRRAPAPPSAAARLRELAWLPWMFARNLAMLVVVVVVAFVRLGRVALARAPGK
ncbi:MAG: ADP-ribosylglycohydrolase family protein [Rubrivivax sp.]|nr:ADP-ribosylglycohydrolase family protein [Rubrivivax sp.]